MKIRLLAFSILALSVVCFLYGCSEKREKNEVQTSSQYESLNIISISHSELMSIPKFDYETLMKKKDNAYKLYVSHELANDEFYETNIDDKALLSDVKKNTRCQDMVIDRAFLDNLLEKNNVMNFLRQNGAQCKSVYNYAILDVHANPIYKIPLFLWFDTDKGKFCFQIIPDEDTDEIHYKLCTQDEFFDLFSQKDGKLIVNGKTIDEENVSIIYKGATFPFSEAVEALGGKYNFDEEKNKVTFCFENGSYSIENLYDCAKAEITVNDETTERSLLYGFTYKNNEIMTDSRLAYDILRHFGYSIEVNCNDKTVVINSNSL